MSRDYLVVRITENSDLYYDLFDTRTEAIAFIDSNSDKALLISAVATRDDIPAPILTIEDHT